VPAGSAATGASASGVDAAVASAVNTAVTSAHAVDVPAGAFICFTCRNRHFAAARALHRLASGPEVPER